MDSIYLEQLRNCCRDEVAFEQMMQILAIAGPGESLKRQKTLFHVIAKIRESLELDTIFKKTAIEVRQLLDADRVGVFRFDPGSGWNDGEFVSEDVLPKFASVLHAKVHDHCFGSQYGVHYQQGKIQAISDIYAAGLEACHVEILSQFQIRANLVVPLRQVDYLWGLLCIHQCEAPRQWQADEIEFVNQVAIHLGVAIQQAELLAQTQQQSADLAQALQDLKRSHTHLIQSEKMSSLGQLVAGVAHEINNPVNFIYGNLAHAIQYAGDLLEILSLYQQEYPDPGAALQERILELDLDFLMEDFPKILSSMQVGADRIRQIVLSLRNFSRLDEAAMKPVDIHEGLDSTLLILQHRLKPRPDSAGIQVIKEYGDLPLVECYASQLNQVFMNILSNAIDALEELQEEQRERDGSQDVTQPWGKITIQTELLSYPPMQVPCAVIRLKDNGGGITPAVQAKLFDPFFTTKPVGKGTGLGLSISHQIVVERHGGTLECYSRLGEGTEFCIAIPVQQIDPKQEVSLTCTIDS